MLQWMDNFQLYGTDANRVARMLNGLWAQANNMDLVADPDPTAGGTFVVQFFTNGGPVIRRVLSAPQTTVGVAARYWLSALPSAVAGEPILASFRDTNNVIHGYLIVNPTGYLEYYRNDTAGPVLLKQSDNPVVISNAWRHTETKLVLDVAAGSVNVRLEGVNVLTVAGVRTTSNIVGAIATCSNVAIQNAIGVSAPFLYVKDLIVWDGSGAFNNDFLGSCTVYRVDPNADVSLNWTPSAGATGFNLINELTPDDDGSYISAPTPAPAPYVCSLSDLPVSVTSVKAVMPIHRSRKTDGGDGQIQTGLISGGVTGLGANRTITTAYTYWFDVIERDPNGGGAWTRVSVNAMNMQLNRTV